jgi:DNA-binding response OmpR family regulator
MSKILIVEDEMPIVDLISMGLKANGYKIDYALDGEVGADLIEKNHYDLILLDIMLPKFDGYELLEYAKQEQIPVIFITAKGELKDKVKGLNMGADDYIVKPFEMEELIARVNSLLRRFKGTISLPNIKINTKTHEVQKEGLKVSLTPKEYDLLIYLIENAGNILTREQILASVWDKEMEDTRTVDLHLARLRKKLGLENVIKTLPKVGYLFEV